MRDAALKIAADKLLADVESILGSKADPDRARVEEQVEAVLNWIRAEAKRHKGDERAELRDSAKDLNELWDHVLDVVDNGLDDDEECDDDL